LAHAPHDRGQHGKAWPELEAHATRARFDDGSMKGRAKMFEVGRPHNDVSFIDTFLTEDFVREHGMFTTHYDKRTKTWVVDSDEFKDIKRKVLSIISTRGAPRVFVIDANLTNRGELLLRHPHEGQDIQGDHAQRVLGKVHAAPSVRLARSKLDGFIDRHAQPVRPAEGAGRAQSLAGIAGPGEQGGAARPAADGLAEAAERP
jgi:spore cortex formation protein SpoVR/YcgB (stage V sporulation)